MLLTHITLPESLKIVITDFACYSGLDFFKINNSGSGRRFCTLNTIDHPLQQEVANFAKQCYSMLDIDVIEEPLFGNFIGFNTTNAFVHSHMDGSIVPDHEHVRLNFLVSKPEAGGMPVINDIVLAVNESQCWLNIASQWEHSSTPVQGAKPRIVLSLGSIVPVEKLNLGSKVFMDAR